MIHSSAIVSDKATIADDVEIGAFSIIGDDVEIGSGTRIDSHVVISGPTKIGSDNHIYQFASVGDDPQDKKYADEPTTLSSFGAVVGLDRRQGLSRAAGSDVERRSGGYLTVGM